MTRKQALAELIEKVEAGNPAKVKIWYWAVGSRYNVASKAAAGYLDAAKALHDAVLPGWDCTLSIGASHASLSEPIGINPTRGWYPGPEAEADTPARAWLLAILRALYAQETDA